MLARIFLNEARGSELCREHPLWNPWVSVPYAHALAVCTQTVSRNGKRYKRSCEVGGQNGTCY